jgi:hypothetical protein
MHTHMHTPLKRCQQMTKQSLPSKGTLTLTFIASHVDTRDAQTLSPAEFDSLWVRQVQPMHSSRCALLLPEPQPQPQPLLQSAAASASSSSSSAAAAAGAAAGAAAAPALRQAALCSASGVAAADSRTQLHGVTDSWKMQLLRVRGPQRACVLRACTSAQGAHMAPPCCARCSMHAVHGAPGHHPHAPHSAHTHAHTHTHTHTRAHTHTRHHQVLLQDCYFSSAQAGQVVASFAYGEDKVEAAVKVRVCVCVPSPLTEPLAELVSWLRPCATCRVRVRAGRSGV